MTRTNSVGGKKPTIGRESVELWSMMIPVMALIILFCYVPLYGIVIAFQNYFPGRPFFGAGVEWVGLKHFISFVRGEYFMRIISNSIYLNLLNLVFGFTAPILFAIVINLVPSDRFRKVTQTISYMPYFISMVIVAGMVTSFIDTSGLITKFLTLFGLKAQNYRLSAKAFPTVYTVTNVWKGFGFGSILYLSTLRGIDPGLYESAKLDGANRFAQTLHITLPGLAHIIAINLIFSLGAILGANSELVLLLYSPSTYKTADVIGTYVYRQGIEHAQYSYTTAVGLFMSVIGFALTYAANKASGRITGYGLW